MLLKEENIIKYFSEMMQQEILKFCDRINRIDADVLILMARKAPCFFQVLVENGYISSIILEKTIITDRAVDFSSDYVKNKKVAIIDDVIFSGTTIAKMVCYLETLNPKSIEVVVLAINKDYFKMQLKHGHDNKELIDRDQCAKLSGADCTKLCSDISRVLSLIGKPYDVDFPAHCDIYSDYYQWVNFPQYFKWFNISNRYQKQAEIEAYTIIPLSIFNEIIWRYLNFSLEKVSECKIRVFSYKISDKEYKLKLLPMFVINEISTNTLEHIFRRISIHLKECNKDIQFIDKFITKTAKFRFIQYYVAELFLNAFLCVTNLGKARLHEYSVNYLFGYDYFQEIYSVINRNAENLVKNIKSLSNSLDEEMLEIREDIEPNLLGYNLEEKDELLNGEAYDINDMLLSPFKYWYTQKEVCVREQLADEKITLDDIDIFQGVTRLEEGFSFNALCKIIQCLDTRYKVREVVSLFIDRAIDLGILVPIVYQNKEKEYLCRAFRHGEDLPYCDIDKQLVLYFLYEFGTKIKNTFSLKQFHKIIVLYMQLGSRKHLFNEFENFDYSELLTAQYALEGGVPVIIYSGIDPDDMHPYVVYNDYSVWLSEEYRRKGILILEDEHQFSIAIDLIKCKIDNISESALTETELLATIISEWFEVCVKSNKKSVFTEDITILTTCYDTSCFAAAMLAELYVCQLDVKNTIVKKLCRVDDSDTIKYFREELRKDSAFLAMNNGRKKFQWYKRGKNDQNRMHIAIENVRCLFEEERNKYAVLLWKKYWEDYSKIIPSQDELDNHILEAVEYIYCYNILYRKIEMYFKPEDKSKNEREIEDLKDEIKILFLDKKIKNDLFNLYEIDSLKEIAQSLNNVVIHQMPEIERATVKNRNSYIQVFDGSLVISTSKKNKNRIINILPSIRDLYFRNKEVIWFELDDEDRGVFALVINKSIKDRKQKLIEAAIEMHRILDNECVGIKTIVTPRLPREKAYRQNIKDNNSWSKERFKKHTVDLLMQYFLEKNSAVSELMVFGSDDEDLNSISMDDIKNIERRLPGYVSSAVKTVKIQQCEKEFRLMEFTGKIKKIGIITVISEEVKAVCDFFGMEKLDKSKQITQRTYYGNSYLSGTAAYDLVMTQCPMEGNQAAMATYYAMNQDFELDYIILLGVAGSIDKDKLKICDVVIAREVVDGQLGKERGKNDFVPETKMYMPNAIVNGCINDFMVFSLKYESAEGSPEKMFTCIYEPIGDNNHLIGSTESKFVNNTKSNITRKIVAVEMESAGVMYGAYLACLDAKCGNVIVIRGISDYADPDKPSDNKFHYPAALNAAKVLSKLFDSLA